jgi:hypothetical protein
VDVPGSVAGGSGWCLLGRWINATTGGGSGIHVGWGGALRKHGGGGGQRACVPEGTGRSQ